MMPCEFGRDKGPERRAAEQGFRQAHSRQVQVIAYPERDAEFSRQPRTVDPAEPANLSQAEPCSPGRVRLESGDAGLVTAASNTLLGGPAQVSSRVNRIIDGAEKQQGEIRAALVEQGAKNFGPFRNRGRARNVQGPRPEKRSERDAAKARQDKYWQAPGKHGGDSARVREELPPYRAPLPADRNEGNQPKADYNTVFQARQPHKE